MSKKNRWKARCNSSKSVSCKRTTFYGTERIVAGDVVIVPRADYDSLVHAVSQNQLARHYLSCSTDSRFVDSEMLRLIFEMRMEDAK